MKYVFLPDMRKITYNLKVVYVHLNHLRTDFDEI
jgi:hypothetical protein